MLTSVATVALTMCVVASAYAAEPLLPDYGPIIQVQDYLTARHNPGERVAILGFPLCSEMDECRLLAGREYVRPRIPFSALKLERMDQDRLLHCLDPERGAKPCIIVLYGEALSGRTVLPQHIEWRAYD